MNSSSEAAALEITNLNKTYDNGFTALEDVCLNVQKGDFFALLGPNGAGKSTTLGIISTLVRKTSGSISVFGWDLDRHPMHVKSQIGIVPQEFNFNGFESVEQTLLWQGPYYGLSRKETKKRAAKYLALLGLEPKAKTQMFMLSGGQKRRVLIARALMHEPPLLFLDEPTAGVDIEIRRSMWTWLSELNQTGTTIVLTTHYLEEAQNLCRNIAIINRGKVIANTSMHELLRQLDSTTFLFEFKQALPSDLSDLRLRYSFDQKDSHSLRLGVQKDQDLNAILKTLMDHGLELHSIQPVVNQLESLFVTLTQQNNAAK